MFITIIAQVMTWQFVGDIATRLKSQHEGDFLWKRWNVRNANDSKEIHKVFVMQCVTSSAHRSRLGFCSLLHCSGIHELHKCIIWIPSRATRETFQLDFVAGDAWKYFDVLCCKICAISTENQLDCFLIYEFKDCLIKCLSQFIFRFCNDINSKLVKT